MAEDQDYDSLVQNLKDAGCAEEMIDRFMEEWNKDDRKEQLQVLSGHRKILLDMMHTKQRQIDCLDYLMYQLRKR